MSEPEEQQAQSVLSQPEIDALLGAVESQDEAPEQMQQQAMLPPPPPPLPVRALRAHEHIQEPQMQSTNNTYMDQVVAQQAHVANELKGKRRMATREGPGASQHDASQGPAARGGGEAGPDGPAVDVRITGWWRWKKVIVPPNAYVVHNRLGKREPLHCGLGVSFDFDPYTDSYLVVPSAMQTIMISANSICKERQGVLVQGYVQWIIDDFATAYKKLDFSDTYDPMKVVNLQLQEQAEAAIKDTVAVMSIDDVLTDKQPIVKVLTARLRQLAEGDGKEDGLGLRIITVQIKEAVVSSTRLWESLQRGFRAERQKEARLEELKHQEAVNIREAEAEQAEAARRIALDEEISQHRSRAESAAYDREQTECVRRAKLEAETLAELTENQKAGLRAQASLELVRIEGQLEQEQPREQARLAKARADLELLAARRKVENDLSPAHLQQRLIETLPQVARELPKPGELKSVSIGGVDGLAPLVNGVLELVDRVRQPAQNGAAG